MAKTIKTISQDHRVARADNDEGRENTRKKEPRELITSVLEDQKYSARWRMLGRRSSRDLDSRPPGATDTSRDEPEHSRRRPETIMFRHLQIIVVEADQRRKPA